jgi:serine/threonine-protein kinase
VAVDALAGRYLLDSPIASGGMATVWRARDNVLARAVAVKVLHKHLAADEMFLERFRIEALAAARLSHPNIVAIYDTGQEGAGNLCRHFIVMEFCAGGNLAERLATEGPLPPRPVAWLGREACAALAYAHRAGVVHRDVKPANVLLAGDQSLKVADFGIAKAAFAAGDVTTTSSILGTVTYLSPEQLRGEEPDGRSDLYSLGVTLYELLAGRPPFEAENELAIAMMHLREEPPPLRSVAAGIPPSLETVVMTALAKDPKDRFASADEMARALETTESGSTSTAALPRITTRRSQTRSVGSGAGRGSPSLARVLLPVLLLIAFGVIAAVALTALIQSEDTSPGSDAPGEQNPPPAQVDQLEIGGVTDLDPVDPEHPEEAPLAADGDGSTAWTTSTYSASFEALGKSGVGLVFDLGDQAEVAGVKVSGCRGCSLELRASDQTSTDDPSLFEVVDTVEGAGNRQEFSFDPRVNRYWLVFITSLPGGGEGGSASISEVRFFGP